MTQVISFLFSAGYYIVCLSVLLRAVLMYTAYLKTNSEGRKKAGSSLAISAAVEIAWCALVGLSFSVSRVDFIPLALSILGLSALRRIAPFEKVGSQHVYSLLSSMIPQKQASLARATALHLF
jgi:hypothetical protein